MSCSGRYQLSLQSFFLILGQQISRSNREITMPFIFLFLLHSTFFLRLTILYDFFHRYIQIKAGFFAVSQPTNKKPQWSCWLVFAVDFMGCQDVEIWNSCGVRVLRQQQLFKEREVKNHLMKRLILGLWLIFIVAGINCQYSTQSSCEAVSCLWTNNTCAVGSSSCLDGWSYSSSIQECVQCSTLASTNCTPICAKYYYSSSKSSCLICSTIDQNCVTCTSSACTSCVTGFSVNSNYSLECLIDACKIRYCQTCLGSACASCQTGYVPSTNGTFCSVASCSIANCLYCYTSASCVTCQTGYQLTSGGTVCKLICNDPYCSSCSAKTTCTSCKSGYTYDTTTGYCKLQCTVQYCTSCDLSTTCTSCATGYTVNSGYTLCIPVCSDANCATCTTPTTCINCVSGYTLTNGTCTKAICYIDYCSTCLTSSTCAKCNTISTLSANKTLCVQNCLSFISNCKLCLTSSTCGACNAGYSLASSTSCTVSCSIANCSVCLTSTLCQYCKTGFITANGGASCIFNCGILNCATCASTTTCLTCSGVYTLSASATSCSLVCSPGFYLNGTQGLCQSCSDASANCASCSISTNSTIICSKCYDLYYLTPTGSCGLCSQAITNCLKCTSATVCTSCESSYNLVVTNNVYTCVTPYSCNVSNCFQCASNNPLKCQTCNVAYYLSDTNGTKCSLIECLDTQYYDSATLTCKCPVGSFLINNKCGYCDISNCVTCNSGGCTVCKAKYYANNGACVACVSNCDSCTSGTSCSNCASGYTLNTAGTCSEASNDHGSTVVGGSSSSSNSSNTSTVAICPAGCQKCAYNSISTSIYCTVPQDGYAIDSTGSIIRCFDSCLTCASTNYAICTSCYGSATLIGGACQGCADPYATACPVNVNYATACITGYSNIAGVCKQCADNCATCGVAGAGRCDNGACNQGYVKIVGTNNCTKCFQSCATCSTNNPSTCLTCGTSSFLSNSSSCISCPTTCLSCSSLTVCTSCPSSNYVLQSDWCYQVIGYPCATQVKSTCTACYLGFNLVSGSCVADTTCNGTLSCTTCNTLFYLSKKQCFPCQTSSNCLNCDPKSPTKCLKCVSGYYLKKSTQVCNACSDKIKGCTECISSNYCTAVSDGYYLVIDGLGEYTGKVKECDSSCATCSDGSSCDTCVTNYKKIGTSCFYSKNIEIKITLGPAAGSNNWFKDINDDETNLANAFVNLNQIISAILSALKITNNKRMIVTGLALGSIVFSSTVASDPAEDFTSFTENVQTSTTSIPDFSVVGTSLVINGATTSSSSANSALILGITIPLVVLLAVIIIIVKIKLSDPDAKDTQDTQKEIQDQFEM